MAVHFYASSQFEQARAEIEQHLFDAVLEVESEIDLALRFAGRTRFDRVNSGTLTMTFAVDECAKVNQL